MLKTEKNLATFATKANQIKNKLSKIRHQKDSCKLECEFL